MTKPIHAGTIVAPQGIKGELRVKTDLADVTLLLKSAPLEITHAKLHKPGLAVIKVKNIADRNAAEKLRGTVLQLERAHMPDDAVYHADLIGLNVTDTGGKALGTVKSVLNFGAGDVLEITPPSGGDTYLQPLLIEKVDLQAKQLVIKVLDVI